MFKVIVTGHGNFASAMSSAFELIAGKNEDVKFIDFDDNSPLNLENRINDTINSFGSDDEVVILCDLVGGTPFKTSVECSTKSKINVEVIGGCNLPMLINIALSKDFSENLDELVNATVDAGKESILHFTFNSKTKEIDEDGI